MSNRRQVRAPEATRIRRRGARLRWAGTCVAALALLGACDPHAQPSGTTTEPASSPVRPAADPVKVSLRAGSVRIAGGLHPYARVENDGGRLPQDQRIDNLSLFFKLSPEQRRDRDALAAAQLDPKSPLFRHWLTPEDYAARFGAKPEDIARASAWLREQGLDVHRTSRLGTRVTFSGSVKSLESAFQTEMHYYIVRGEPHYAMAVAPAFPGDLADVVLGLHNTHDFYPRPVSSALHEAAMKRRSSSRFEAAPDGGPDGGPLDLLGPPDWAAAYDVARLYDPGIGGKKLDGTGVTIGIVGTAQIAQSDIDAFRTMFNLPATTVTMTLVPDTGAAGAGRRGGGLEAILDTEWSGGIARGATINYVFVGANDRNVDDAALYLIEENLAPVMSESYGGCEAGALPTDADVLEENGTAANLMGITYMAAAGDAGAADCGSGAGGSGLYVDMPGSYPGVTSVGGTQFPSPGWNAQGNLLAYPSLEQVWNEGNDPYSRFGVGAGGGGISSVFARPAYQASIGTCAPIGGLPVIETPSNFRQIPDVALSAASETPGYFVECTFGTGGDCAATGGAPEGLPIGGTSAASPTFAGVVAILNQAVGERLGNINPLLYALAAEAPSAAPFHDIVSGNNEVACGDGGVVGDAAGPGDAGWPSGVGCGANGLYGYPATTGYDCASGLGSIDAYNLVSALIGLSKTKTGLTAAPTQTTEGAMVTLSATVDTVGASSAVLTGNVTFTFESFTTTGATDLSWELGTVALTGATGAGASATLETVIPPGLVKPSQQWVDVIATYGGDTKHLSSVSPKVGIGFHGLSFAIDPATVMLAPDGTHGFTTTGGDPPVRWYVVSDTTRGRTDAGFGAAGIDETTGVLQVGPKAGYVEIEAIDKYGAEARAEITVGAPTVPPPWSADGGVYIDGGVPPAVDAGKPRDAGAEAGERKDAGKDAGRIALQLPDAGGGEPASGGGGCSCEVVRGRGESGGVGGGVGVVMVGLGMVGRRRRRAG